MSVAIDVAEPIAIIEFICVVLYVVPRTSILAAVLLTGYLGGAIAAQLRRPSADAVRI